MAHGGASARPCHAPDSIVPAAGGPGPPDPRCRTWLQCPSAQIRSDSAGCHSPGGESPVLEEFAAARGRRVRTSCRAHHDIHGRRVGRSRVQPPLTSVPQQVAVAQYVVAGERRSIVRRDGGAAIQQEIGARRIASLVKHAAPAAGAYGAGQRITRVRLRIAIEPRRASDQDQGREQQTQQQGERQSLARADPMIRPPRRRGPETRAADRSRALSATK